MLHTDSVDKSLQEQFNNRLMHNHPSFEQHVDNASAENDEEDEEEEFASTSTTSTSTTTTTAITSSSATMNDDQPSPSPSSASLSDAEYRASLKESIGTPVAEKKTGSIFESLAKSLEIRKSGELKKSQYTELKGDVKKSSSSDLRKNSSSDLKRSNNSELRKSWNPFKKSINEMKKEDEDELIRRLSAEGKSEEEIASHINQQNEAKSFSPSLDKQQQQQTQQQTQQQQTATPNKSGGVGGWFRSIQQALREEFSVRRSGDDFIDPNELRNSRLLTVNISSAPFYGAVPDDHDLSLEDLAKLESVYQNDTSQCINNLPITKYDGTPLPGQQSTCPICITEFQSGEQLKNLFCIHFFHKECIDRWLMVGHTCPVCKQLVE